VHVFLSDLPVKGSVMYDGDDDDDVLLIDVSQESIAGRMVSTPLLGHPAAIDISDVISSIRGNLLYTYVIALFL